MLITESGTPDAYHLVTVPANTKSVLNLKNISVNGIEIDADYVIVQGCRNQKCGNAWDQDKKKPS